MQQIVLDTEIKNCVEKLSSKEFIDFLAQSENDDTASLLYHYCAQNIEFFCRAFFPHFCTYDFCDIQRDAFRHFKFGSRGVKTCTAAPRGYAKSTLKAFFEIIHDICYHQERYIIVASNTEEQSIAKLKDIKSELIENNFLREVYGDFFDSGTIASREFICVNWGFEIRIQAVSSKKEIRGVRFKNFRPTKIVIDDFEHSTEVESEEIRTKYEATFNEVFSKLGNKDTNIHVVGTVLHQRSLLKKILKNPSYKSKVYVAINAFAERKDMWNEWKKIYTDLDNDNREKDSDKYFEDNKEKLLKGTSVLWEQHESYLLLQKEIVTNGLRAFYKEKQNNPMASEDKIFDPHRIRYYTDHGDRIVIDLTGKEIKKNEMVSFGAVDPAVGQNKPNKNQRGDFTCILSGYSDDRGRLFVQSDYTKRIPPSTTIQKIFALNDLFHYYYFGVEENLYRGLLISNIRDEEKKINEKKGLKDKKKRMNIKSIYQSENKEKRIYTLEPKVENGYIYFNRNLSDEFYGQLFDFPKGDHDDCPDALEMLYDISTRTFGVGLRVGRG